MSWPCDASTWSHLLSFNDILLSLYLLLTFRYIKPHLSIVKQSSKYCINENIFARVTNRHSTTISISTYQYPLLGFVLFGFRTIWELEHPTKLCNGEKVYKIKSAEDNAYIEDFTIFYKHCILGTSVIKSKYMAR